MKAATPILVLSIHRKCSKEGDWHRHMRGQLFIVTEGILLLDTKNERCMMPAQRAGWIPPMHKHKATTHGTISAESFYLIPELCKLFPSYTCVFTPSPLLREIITQITTWKTVKKLSPRQMRLLQVMKDELNDIKPEPFNLPIPKNKSLEQLAHSFIVNPSIEKSLDVWAYQANMTKRTFTRHFRQETGLSFSKWCQQVRIMHALELLAKGEAVTSVALSLGYDSVSAFIKVFSRYLGSTPSHFKH